MSYIGREPTYGVFERQIIVPDGIKKRWKLNYAIGSASSVLVALDGVIQEPTVAYFIVTGGREIEFSTPPGATQRLSIIYLGKQLLVPRQAGQETSRESFVGNGVKTDFYLQANPVFPSGLIVFKNGVQQVEGSNFNLLGNIVRFTLAPALSDKIEVYILAREKTTVDTPVNGSVSYLSLNSDLAAINGIWELIATNKVAEVGRWYMADTLGGPITLSLPPNPYLGVTMEIIDYSGSFDTNNLIIDRNGHKINGVSSNFTCAVENVRINLVYMGPTYGWNLFIAKNTVGGGGASSWVPLATSALDMSGFAINNVAAATTTGQPVTYEQIVGGGPNIIRQNSIQLTSSAGVLTIDWNLGSQFYINLTENITSVVFQNVPAAGKGQNITMMITQGASVYSITGWPSSVKWFYGSYAVTNVPNATDEVGLTYYNSSKVLGKFALGAE